MTFVEIGIQKVRMVYIPIGEPGSFNLHQDCGLGCKCESLIFKCTPNIESAGWMILCFNDAKGQGISGKGCKGKAISEGPDTWIYEIDAKLKEQRPGPLPADPFPRTRNTPPPMPPCKHAKEQGAAPMGPAFTEQRADLVYANLEKLQEKMAEKAGRARDVARQARKRGDTRKWDKFNAIARVYEMSLKEMWCCYEPLCSLTSKEFQNSMIPF